MNRFKKILFFITTFVIIAAVVVFFSSTNKTPSPNTTVPFDERGPTSFFGPVTIKSIYPEENPNTTFLPIQQISITFSEPILPSSVIAVSSPKVDIEITTDVNNPNTIVISPNPVWEPGITTLTIKASSGSNAKVGQTLIYRLKTDFPKNDPELVQ